MSIPKPTDLLSVMAEVFTPDGPLFRTTFSLLSETLPLGVVRCSPVLSGWVSWRVPCTDGPDGYEVNSGWKRMDFPLFLRNEEGEGARFDATDSFIIVSSSCVIWGDASHLYDGTFKLRFTS